MLIIAFQNNEKEIKDKQKKVKKTYSIKELLSHDSSDEEGFKEITNSNQFPWLSKNYKHVSDELHFIDQAQVQNNLTESYPASK